MYLKILFRESVVYMKKENLDQITPSNSPKAPGIKSKFGKERVHREELSPNVNLYERSPFLARQNSGKDHMRRPCTEEDLLVKHG